MKKNQSNTLKLNLLENAKTSLHHAVSHLSDNKNLSINDYKCAIRDVVHSLELLFKEKLKRIHPAFTWSNIDKYPNKEAHTVSLDTAINRLHNIVGVSFLKEHIDNIKSIKKLRNDIEHYELEIDEKLAKIHIGRILSFLFWFGNEHLKLKWESEFQSDDSWDSLMNIHQFFNEHIKVIENRMDKEQRYVRECPECGAITYDMIENKCAFCLHINQVFLCEWCGESFFCYEMSTKLNDCCERCEINYLNSLKNHLIDHDLINQDLLDKNFF